MPRVVLAKWRRIRFPTTEIKKFIPEMPYLIPDKEIKVRGGTNKEHLRRLYPKQMRLKEIAHSVNKLIDEERVEFTYFRGYETRNYTERLIAEAIRYGDCHKPTMELANFYLQDKTLIHKLFKILVPRYLNYTKSFTSMYLLSNRDIDWTKYSQRTYVEQRVLIELKDNPYPSIFPDQELIKENLLHNILLGEVANDENTKKIKQNN